MTHISAYSAHELESLAADRLDRAVYDFIAGGADDETAIAANAAAFRRFEFRNRVLTGSGWATPRARLLGDAVSAPLFVAPMGAHRLVDPAGERASAAAAKAADIGYVTSAASSVPLEEVAAVAGPATWFQLYWLRDRALTARLLARVEAAGYRAIVLTVDMPTVGLRRRDVKNGYSLPQGVRHANLDGEDLGDVAGSAPGGVVYFGRLVEGALGWNDLAWLREQTTLPLVLKGLTTAEDARIALDAGVDAVYVSNHGGRQLGDARAALDSTVEVVDAVCGRIPVFMDGGVRSAADAVKAFALGADAVGIGRPVLWALAALGADGVRDYLCQFVEDVARTMTLLGVAGIDGLSPNCLAERTAGVTRRDVVDGE